MSCDVYTACWQHSASTEHAHIALNTARAIRVPVAAGRIAQHAFVQPSLSAVYVSTQSHSWRMAHGM